MIDEASGVQKFVVLGTLKPSQHGSIFGARLYGRSISPARAHRGRTIENAAAACWQSNLTMRVATVRRCRAGRIPIDTDPCRSPLAITSHRLGLEGDAGLSVFNNQCRARR